MKTLTDYQSQCPELTCQNRGYGNISTQVQDKHSNEIKEIEVILKTVIKGFSKFNNFRINLDGEIEVRCQYYWSSSFCGVGYFLLSEIESELLQLDKK